ncbi:hypothetical protein JRO89_XS09G0004400 [Xanthoceras sorbifolium]|uniref:Protein kinase domain-containing protein n=1 Tax=Xanthoceras sorbifolium TaxID=99658 RepID=A0ABQ8HK19_9ROSI|nr:hypothetical protein JRO89_XS09G0004400 [Xanthoceras sorbifolium]
MAKASRTSMLAKDLPLSPIMERFNSLMVAGKKDSVDVIEYHLLESATNNFGESNVLGEGPTHGSDLTWHLRLKIAVNVAKTRISSRALQPPIVHRDLKSSNILLDSALMQDFGLAVTAGTQNKNVKLSGTLGHVAPEYLLEAIEKASDRKKASGKDVTISMPSIVTWAMPQLTDRSKLPNIVDPVIKRHMDLKHLYQCPGRSNDGGGRNEPGSLGVNGNTCGVSGVEENMGTSGGAGVNSLGGDSCSGGGRIVGRRGGARVNSSGGESSSGGGRKIGTMGGASGNSSGGDSCSGGGIIVGRRGGASVKSSGGESSSGGDRNIGTMGARGTSGNSSGGESCSGGGNVIGTNGSAGGGNSCSGGGKDIGTSGGADGGKIGSGGGRNVGTSGGAGVTSAAGGVTSSTSGGDKMGGLGCQEVPATEIPALELHQEVVGKAPVAVVTQ